MKFLNKKNYFLYLIILAFVFISSTAMALSGDFFLVEETVSLPVKISKSFPPNPVLASGDSFPVLSAQGALAVDLESGVTLYEKNPDTKLLPASTTKIITALVVLDTFPLDEVIKVGAINVDGQKMGLYRGEEITVENLLYGLLVYSANDAAQVLANSYPEGYDAFVLAMDAKAKELSMTNTHFDNPVGFDTDDQHSTTRDLVRASEVAMRNPVFAKIVGTKEIFLTDVTGKTKYNLRNINQLLGTVPGVIGVKTGWTQGARENLVTYIKRDGHTLVIALLGSQDRFGETKELIDWIFANYDWQEVKLPR